MSETSLDVLHDLRRRRKRHRLGDIEWFDAAYRVYLVALFGGGTVLWISSSISDTAGRRPGRRRHRQERPGADRHDHRAGLPRRPAQRRAGWAAGARGRRRRLRHAVARRPHARPAATRHPTAAQRRVRSPRTFGAIVGQLAGRRLPGTPLAWAAAVPLFGHRHRRCCGPAPRSSPTPSACRCGSPRRSASPLRRLAGRRARLAHPRPGQRRRQPGAVGLAPAPRSTSSPSAVAVDRPDRRGRAAAAHLARRARPAQQPGRPAALRRHDAGPAHRHPAASPAEPGADRGARRGSRVPRWITASDPAPWRCQRRSLPGDPVGAHDRASRPWPACCQAMVVRGTTPALLGTALMLFVLGLEAMEPLSQEVDQPDRTDSLPIERGELLVRHLVAPAVALVPFAVVAAASAVAVLGTSRAIAPAAILALPTVLGRRGRRRRQHRPRRTRSHQGQHPGVRPAGDGRHVHRDARRHSRSSSARSPRAPCCSCASAQRARQRRSTGAALRGAIGAPLLAILVAYWVRRRDHWRASSASSCPRASPTTTQQRSTPA